MNCVGLLPSTTDCLHVQSPCRAKIAAVRAGAAGDGHGVPPGTYVDVHLGHVPEEAAQKVVQRVEAANKVTTFSETDGGLSEPLPPHLPPAWACSSTPLPLWACRPSPSSPPSSHSFIPQRGED